MFFSLVSIMCLIIIFLIFDTDIFTVQTHFLTMADEQVAAVPAPANNLTAIQSFYRILYNGDSTNKLNTKQKPVDFANIQDVFECAITMAQENIELPIAAIKKVCIINKWRIFLE